MSTLIALLGLICLIAAFVGLISPKTVLFKWGDKLSRFQTFMLFITLFVICVSVGGSLSTRDYEERKKKAESELAEKGKTQTPPQPVATPKVQPPPAPVSAPKVAAPKQVSPVTKPPEAEAWYKRGTLHKSTVGDWHKATYENRLATAASFLLLIIDESDRPALWADDQELWKRGAGILEKCITSGTQRKGKVLSPKLSVSAAATVCLDGMKSHKKQQ